MLTNLQIEMLRHNISKKDLEKALNLKYRAINNKINEKTEFTLSEIKIVKSLFPDNQKFSIDYLFASNDANEINL